MRRSQKAGIRKAKSIKSAHGRQARYNAELNKLVMKRWATDPTMICSGYGEERRKDSFFAYWCQWFPKAKVTTRWNKCKKA